MTKPPAWKDVLPREQPLLLPCAHDALSARLGDQVKPFA
jgi:hypothetical protein